MATYTISQIELPNGDICTLKNENTTYSFSAGSNKNELNITSGGETQTVTLKGIEVIRL